MGLLDQYFDPATLEAVKQFGQPSEEERRQARNNALMNAGFAMMMNNQGRSKSDALFNALGAGGMAGTQSYQGQLEEARQRNQQQFQMAGALQKLQQEAAQRKAQQEAIAQLPQADQQAIAAGVPYKEMWTERNKGFTLAPGEKRFVGGQTVAGLDSKPELKEGYIVSDGKGGWTIDPALYEASLKRAAAGASRVNVNQPYEPQFNKELATLDAKSLDGMRGKAEAGQSMLGTIARMRSLNDKVYSNGTAEAKMAVANMLAGLGVNIGDPAKLANSQEFDSLATKLTIDSLGGSLGPGVSNSDVIFLKKTVPQAGHSAEARNQLYDFLEKKAKSQIDTYSSARSYAERNNGLKGWSAPSADVPDKPKSKFFKVDGAQVAGTLGADGNYYVEKNGKKFRIQQD